MVLEFAATDRIQIFRMRAALLAVCFVLQVAGARADVDLNQQLNSNYRDKTFFIRGFCKDSHLKYTSAGEPIGNAHTGYWTVDGGVQIRKIKVSGSRLRVQAERLLLDLEAGEAMVFRPSKQWVTGHDNLLDLVPDYWKPCLAAALAGPTSKDPGLPLSIFRRHSALRPDVLSSGRFAADELQPATGGRRR
jgi:hypothetical protein